MAGVARKNYATGCPDRDSDIVLYLLPDRFRSDQTGADDHGDCFFRKLFIPFWYVRIVPWFKDAKSYMDQRDYPHQTGRGCRDRTVCRMGIYGRICDGLFCDQQYWNRWILRIYGHFYSDYSYFLCSVPCMAETEGQSFIYGIINGGKVSIF